eukprot:3366173-Amphidinium_carterae.1
MHGGLTATPASLRSSIAQKWFGLPRHALGWVSLHLHNDMPSLELTCSQQGCCQMHFKKGAA